MVNLTGDGYTTLSILEQMIAQVDPSIDTREGSMIWTALGPVAWYLEGLIMVLGQIQQNAYVETAVGESLDLLAANRGIFRNNATPAIRAGIFNVAVPSGSRFRTAQGDVELIYVSGNPIKDQTSGGNYVYQMTCETAGTIGNTYSGNLLPITAIPGLASAVLGTLITPGTDDENDDSLRARYYASFDTSPWGGNIAAYRQEILAIPGVGAVQVYPANSYNGGGTVLCSILNIDLTPADSSLINTVQNIICPLENGEPSPNGYGFAPIGAAVTITTATELALNITCTIQFAANVQNGVETYQSDIEAAIQSYIDSVNQTWGEPLKTQSISYPVNIYISRIINAVLSAVPAVVNMTNVLVNGSGNDLTLTETAELQQVAALGSVVINT